MLPINRITCLFLVCSFLIASVPLYALSPYAGQEHRSIKSLSADEIDGYLEGAGMGFAKSAELNGYPGPKHVMELASKLDLTDEQLVATEQVHARMKQQAKHLGGQIIALEQTIESLFRERKATSTELQKLIKEIAVIKGELRTVHLQAHIEQTALLSTQQIDTYQSLRGYQGDHHDKHHH